MEDCEAKVVNLARHLRDKHHRSVGGAASAISVYGLRKPYERQIKTTPGKIQGSKKTSYQRKRKMSVLFEKFCSTGGTLNKTCRKGWRTVQ